MLLLREHSLIVNVSKIEKDRDLNDLDKHLLNIEAWKLQNQKNSGLLPKKKKKKRNPFLLISFPCAYKLRRNDPAFRLGIYGLMIEAFWASPNCSMSITKLREILKDKLFLLQKNQYFDWFWRRPLSSFLSEIKGRVAVSIYSFCLPDYIMLIHSVIK